MLDILVRDRATIFESPFHCSAKRGGEPMPHCRTIMGAALSLTWVMEASASHLPIGTEFRVNTSTAGAQVDPAAASAPDRMTVVVWAANQHIYGQRYNASSVPLGT